MIKKYNYRCWFTLPNFPAVRFRILSASDKTVHTILHNRKDVAMEKNAQYAPHKCKAMLEEVLTWERVEEMPDNVWQWYELEVGVFVSKLASAHIIIGRPILGWQHGYVQVLEKDVDMG